MELAALYQLYLQHPEIETDTRKLKPGVLFFALSGPNFDGNTFAAEALAKGAAYVVMNNHDLATDNRCIVVDDVLQTLQALAKHHRQQFRIPFIAITGSNGKTTTKELIAAVLSRAYVTYATTGNLNNHIGVPLTLLKIKSDAEMAIIEMGANHQKEIAAYCEIALPDFGLITNCGKAHIEGFGGIEGVRKGKGELYDFLRNNNGSIFINTDLDYLQDMAKGIAKQVTYGTAQGKYTGAPLMDGVLLKVVVSTTGGDMTIHTNLVGVYNFPNVMAAVAIGRAFGVDMAEIKAAIEAYSPDNSRSQWLQKGSNKIILDAYNANPTSMKAAIQNFAAADLPNKMLWIGGMKEMGDAEQEEHQQLVDLIASYTWKDVILVGKEFKGLEGPYRWFETSVDAAGHIAAHPPLDSSILVKGSRGSRMELMVNGEW